MATEEKSSEVTTAPAASVSVPGTSKKKGMLLGGGVATLVSLAWALSLVAVPSGSEHGPEHLVGGPFMADISPSSGFQVNLAGDGGKHYLSLNLKAEVDAYDEAYAMARASEPLHQAKLTDAVLRTASQKTKGELDSAVGREVFRDELRIALDPVLFPVHVGNEHEAVGRHEESGLRPGRSIARSTLRGLFYDHHFQLDVARKTISVDDGAETAFRGDEDDLFVADGRGKGIYVDVTGLDPGFSGTVPTGTFGRVRNVYFNTFLTQ